MACVRVSYLGLLFMSVTFEYGEYVGFGVGKLSFWYDLFCTWLYAMSPIYTKARCFVFALMIS